MTNANRSPVYAQARYWIITVPKDNWSPPTSECLPVEIALLRGQLEIGNGTGYEHWQLFVAFRRRQRLGGVKKFFTNNAHAEPTRSTAAEEYVFKEDTAVPGTRFELGQKVVIINITI